MKEACGDAHMKAILAVGELASMVNVYKASLVCMMAGKVENNIVCLWILLFNLPIIVSLSNPVDWRNNLKKISMIMLTLSQNNHFDYFFLIIFTVFLLPVIWCDNQNFNIITQ